MVFGFLKKVYAKVVTAVARPITKVVAKVLKKEPTYMTSERFLRDPVGKKLSTAAAVVSLPLAAIGLVKAAPFIIKKAIAKPVTALVVGGIAYKSPELIFKTGKGLVTGGMAVGEGYEKAKEKGEEYGIGTALKTGGLVGAGVIAGAMIPAIIGKVKDIPFKEIPFLPSEPEPEEQLIPEKAVGIEGEVPITPEVTTITTGKKPYKRRRAKITPSVRQYVRVNVISQAVGMR